MDAALITLERRTNRAYWSDGLLDLLAGLGLAGIGASWLAGSVVVGACAPAVLIPLWRPLRRAFTEPRLGRVELADAREHRMRRFVRLTLVAGVATFLLVMGLLLARHRAPELASAVVPALPGALVGVLAVATAEALGLRRFFVYGAVCFAVALAVAWVGSIDPGWAMLAGGLAMLGGGATLAIRMLARHRPARTA